MLANCAQKELLTFVNQVLVVLLELVLSGSLVGRDICHVRVEALCLLMALILDQACSLALLLLDLAPILALALLICACRIILA